MVAIEPPTPPRRVLRVVDGPAAGSTRAPEHPGDGERSPLLPVTAGAKSMRSSSSILLRVCSFILVTEFCLWVATLTLTGSLPIFFRKNLGLSSVQATELNSVLLALSNLTPILGAYLADTRWGRFKTITIACVLYVSGMLLCAISATPRFESLPLFLVGLYGGVALGSGGIKPNVVVLGAEQFDLDDPAQRKEKESFFLWFYWAMNVGGFFSSSVLANVSVSGIPGLVPAALGFPVAFFFATAVFIVALGSFYGGRRRYRLSPPQGSALSQFTGVFLQAARATTHGRVVLSGCVAFIPGIVLTTISYFVEERSWHLTLAIAGAAAVIYGTVVLIFSGHSTAWLQRAMETNGGSFAEAQVRDVRQVVRLLPYMSVIIVFWSAFSQMQTNFLIQGCQMDLRFAIPAFLGFSSSDQGRSNGPVRPVLLSSATLGILNSGAVLIFIPMFDRVVYPGLHRLGIRPTLLGKIGTGLLFSFLAMAVAGYIEVTRKHRGFVEGVFSNCASGGEGLRMSAMSIWWQTFPYLFIGLSEILTSITAYDLFYSEVPESMRSACQALNLLAITLGVIISGALNSIFSFWVTTDLNEGGLENIFFIIALLLLLDFVAFVLVSRSFQYHSADAIADAEAGGNFAQAITQAVRNFFATRSPPRARMGSTK